MNIEVIKFGGSCLKDESSLHKVYEIIKKFENPVVVVSALSGITDYLEKSLMYGLDPSFLLKKHRLNIKNKGIESSYINDFESKISELNILYKTCKIGKCSDHLRSLYLSYGERFSALMLAYFLMDLNVDSEVLESDNLGIYTVGNILNSRIDVSKSVGRVREKIIHILEKGKIPIVTGFFGIHESGNVSLLGRNSSDYTASFIALALGAKRVILYKDVDGFFTANPAIVADALPISKLSYDETIELTFGGAKVVHPMSVSILSSSGITMEIRNFEKDETCSEIGNYEDLGIYGLSVYENVEAIEINAPELGDITYWFGKIINKLSDSGQNILKIFTSSGSATIFVSESNRKIVERSLKYAGIKLTLKIARNLSLITLVNKMNNDKIFPIIFDMAKKLGINIYSFGTSKPGISIYLALPKKDCQIFLKEIHRMFLRLDQNMPIN